MTMAFLTLAASTGESGFHDFRTGAYRLRTKSIGDGGDGLYNFAHEVRLLLGSRRETRSDTEDIDKSKLLCWLQDCFCEPRPGHLLPLFRDVALHDASGLRARLIVQ